MIYDFKFNNNHLNEKLKLFLCINKIIKFKIKFIINK